MVTRRRRINTVATLASNQPAALAIDRVAEAATWALAIDRVVARVISELVINRVAELETLAPAIDLVVELVLRLVRPAEVERVDRVAAPATRQHRDRPVVARIVLAIKASEAALVPAAAAVVKA